MKSTEPAGTGKSPGPKRVSPKSRVGMLSYFEVMDRAAMAANNIEDNIGSHTAVQTDSRLKKAYEKLSDAMGEFYQVAGARFFEVSESSERRGRSSRAVRRSSVQS